MFAQAAVTDFRAEVVNTGGLDLLRLLVEVRRGVEKAEVVRALGERVKSVFELTPDIEVLETGTLAREFEKAVKAPRFMDKRA